MRCSRLFHYRYVDRLSEPEIMPEARIGNAIHTALEHVLQGKPLFESTQNARQTMRNQYEEGRFDAIAPGVGIFAEHVEDFRRTHSVDRELIECRMGIREDGAASKFRGRGTYFRGILDAGFLFDGNQLAVIDHKTGQRSLRHTIAEQLEGYAVLAAAHFRQVQHLWLGVYWVSSAHLEWAEPVQIDDVHERFLNNVMDNIEAAALAVADGPRPSTGPWCERCGYRTVCPAGRDIRFEPVDDPDGYLDD